MEVKRLTKDQQRLVENNMDIIDIVLAKKITTHQNIRGMEREELYQVGSLAMCRVAAYYPNCTETEFRKICTAAVYHAMIGQIRKSLHDAGSCVSYDAALNEDEDGTTFGDMLEDPDAIVDQVLITEDTLRKFFSIVNTQSARHGLTAIVLRSRGYTTHEIVNMMQTTESTLYSWEDNARNVLKRYYSRCATATA